MEAPFRIETAELSINRRERLHLPAMRLDYRPAEARILDFDEACLGFTPQTAMREASRCVECPAPQACVLACPLHNDIPSAIWNISQGNFLEAAAIYRQTSNFPELCGRLCPDERLCAGACGVCKFHPPVRLGRLEAFVADFQREAQGVQLPTLPKPSGKRVAVIGSGPAGLTVAEQLAMRGHSVSILEMRRQPGGMLTYAIPRFRLPLHIIEAKVEYLKKLGVKFLFDLHVGSDLKLEDLFPQIYHAVFLGTGAGFEAGIDLPGANLRGVVRATEFLMATNLDESYGLPEGKTPFEIGERVTVVGHGHSAVDCARTAVRLGAQSVVCFTGCQNQETQCRKEDVLAASEEGVQFRPFVQPVELIGDDSGRVRQVHCRPIQEHGPGIQPSIRTGHEATFIQTTDLVIFAPERGPDPTFGGWIVTNKETGQTDHPGIFAAGDNTGKTQLVSAAIAEGRKVAASIHRFLM